MNSWNACFTEIAEHLDKKKEINLNKYAPHDNIDSDGLELYIWIKNKCTRNVYASDDSQALTCNDKKKMKYK